MTAPADSGAAPLTSAEFGRLMDGVGPFEPAPRIAVAFSGGPDSTVLLHLAIDWMKTAGGAVVALVVDHGLRAESAAEAVVAAQRARRAGAEVVVLTRQGEPPHASIQAAARAERYRLLVGWCATEGILHLMLAHHREDQAETLLLRLARGSGVDGLAAMAPVSEWPDLRLLRPLLDVPKDRILATLTARGLAAIGDPSNRNERFDRVRVRNILPLLADVGLGPERLAWTAIRMGHARAALERETARVLARAVAVFPEGYARLDVDVLNRQPDEIGLRVLSRLVSMIGGRQHPPRLDRMIRLLANLRSDVPRRGHTVGGCRLTRDRRGFLAVREAAGIEGAVHAAGGVRWDGRFLIRCAARASRDLTVARLDLAGWRQAVTAVPALRHSVVPPAVRQTLPAVFDLEGVLEIPHLSFVRPGAGAGQRIVQEICFLPNRSVQATRFTRPDQAVNTV